MSLTGDRAGRPVRPPVAEQRCRIEHALACPCQELLDQWQWLTASRKESRRMAERHSDEPSPSNSPFDGASWLQPRERDGGQSSPASSVNSSLGGDGCIISRSGYRDSLVSCGKKTAPPIFPRTSEHRSIRTTSIRIK
ncbi:hypothetical protein ABZS68_20205 [Streptomyces sp. NPDC005571]|uniref:hypothetical protein n=1 Tax=Streptomyces sp. NPDC005571 TaxID=3156888 RepID=UPI0033BB9695